MKRVAVESKNPVKIEATKQAFETLFSDEEWDVQGVDVDSGVSDQPMTDEESITGATNRAKRAMEALDADFGVGLEGGLQDIGEYYFDCGWMVVIDTAGHQGIGSTIRMQTPPRLMELIHQGKELGDANDIIFEKVNLKQAEGHFGLMSNNAITRTRGYTDGVISALAAFVHPQLF